MGTCGVATHGELRSVLYDDLDIWVFGSGGKNEVQKGGEIYLCISLVHFVVQKKHNIVKGLPIQFEHNPYAQMSVE